MNPLTNVKNITKLNEIELKKGYTNKSSWHNEYKNSAWIFIGGLAYGITEGDVITVFSQYGEVVNINMVRDKKTGKTRGFCFLCYANQKSTVLAVDNLNGIKICNRIIRVDHVADYKPPKEYQDTDEITKQLYAEGCAPKPFKKSSSDDEPILIEAPVKLKKHKKEKKKKKKKKKRAKSDSSESDSEIPSKKRSKDNLPSTSSYRKTKTSQSSSDNDSDSPEEKKPKGFKSRTNDTDFISSKQRTLKKGHGDYNDDDYHHSIKSEHIHHKNSHEVAPRNYDNDRGSYNKQNEHDKRKEYEQNKFSKDHENRSHKSHHKNSERSHDYDEHSKNYKKESSDRCKQTNNYRKSYVHDNPKDYVNYSHDYKQSYNDRREKR